METLSQNSQTNSAPLAGVRVLDLSLLLPGPLCSLHLADLGAEVIKVENPRAYDGSRAMFKSATGAPSLFLMLNRNKKAITLNLKRPASKDILFKILANTDILLEGFRPDAMDKMGMGYETLCPLFPKLIYCGISGYGSQGEYKDFAGHDINYLALSGVLSQTGNPPQALGFQVADIGGGSLTALSSILAALYQREKTGKGQKLEISMTDGALQFLSLYAGIYAGTGNSPIPGDELLSGKLPNYNVYKTKEGKFVALGALEEMFFQTFLKVAGLGSLLQDHPLKEENFGLLKQKLAEYFSQRTWEDLEPIFKNEDSCLTPVLSIEDVAKSEYWQNRKMVFFENHPRYGKILQFGSPFGMKDHPLSYRNHPPEHGEHTEEILKSLGYSASDTEGFRKDRVI